MARVPIPTPGSGTQLNPLPNASLRPADFGQSGRMIAGALGQAADATQNYADTQMEIDKALTLAAVKKVDTEDARWVRERLYTGDNAYFKLQGFNAVNARPTVEAEFRDRRNAQRAALTTDRQREIYDRMSEERFGPELTGIARFSDGNLREEEKNQSLAVITEGGNDAVTFWDDPTKRDTAIGKVTSEIRKQGADEGWGEKVTALAVDKAISDITVRAISGKIDAGNIDTASALLEANRGKINPDQESALDRMLYEPLMGRWATGAARSLMADGPVDVVAGNAGANGAGFTLERLTGVVVGLEGGGTIAKPKTSPKGARGPMQVMPTTGADPGYGVKPSNGTATDDVRFGREYLAALYKHYGNDAAKALAAYNGGPGKLDAAMAAAKKAGNPNGWLNYMYKETRDYVAGGIQALGGDATPGAGAVAARQWDLKTLMQRVDAMKLPYEKDRALRAEITRRVSTDEGLLDRQRNTAQEEAYRIVDRLGDGFTNKNQIPPSIRSRLSPQDDIAFGNIAERNTNKGSAKTDWTFYSEVSDSAARDPRGFVSTYTPAQLRAKLGDQEFGQVMSWRRAVLSPSKSQDTPLTVARVGSATDDLLAAAGIVRPPQARGGSRDAVADQAYYQRVGKFRSKILDDAERWQAKHPGQDIDDNTLMEIARRELIPMWRKDAAGAKKTIGFGFEVQTGPGVGYDLDNGARAQIIARYKARFGRAPDEKEIDEIYRYGPRGGR